MGRPGFEPETNRLKAECSTAELATRYVCVKRTISYFSTTTAKSGEKAHKKVTSNLIDAS